VLAVVVIIEVAGRGLRARDPDDDETPVRSSLAARVIVLVCVFAQFGYSLRSARTTYKHMALEIAEAHRNRSPERPEIAAIYRRLQDAIPDGAAFVALVDEPFYFDYTRHRVLNLDTPGFASPPPGIPMFAGAAAKADYLRGLGIRHIVFVHGDHSNYFYRRDYWLERIFWDPMELWRNVAGFQLDMIDSFTELAAQHRVVFDEGGMVVIELPPGRPDAAALARARRVPDEAAARHAWVKALCEREGLMDAWSLMSRGDLVFEEGFSRNLRVARDEHGAWQQVPRTLQVDHGVMARFVNRSNHLRVRGDRDMQLRIAGRIEIEAIFTRPRVTLAVAGHEAASRIVDDDGTFEVSAVVPAAWLDGWTDAYLYLSSVGEPWRDGIVTKVALVERVEWEPVAR
jgi:hypothetical protein